MIDEVDGLERSDDSATGEMSNDMLKPIVEGAILACAEPLTLERIQGLFDVKSMPEKSQLREVLKAIQVDSQDRGFELVEVASGWRFQVRSQYAVWVNKLWEERPQKYSRALLETLALVAYRQPITRGDIEEVRGVSVSSQIIKTLSERDWIKVVGHRDVPGRPALYATTRQFLDYFNLKSLEELPSLGELKDIDGLNRTLDFELSGVSQADQAHSQKEAETVLVKENQPLNQGAQPSGNEVSELCDLPSGPSGQPESLGNSATPNDGEVKLDDDFTSSDLFDAPVAELFKHGVDDSLSEEERIKEPLKQKDMID